MAMFKFLNRKSVEEYQSELLKTHYNEVSNMYSDMRKWRHNYRNHLQILKALAFASDIEAIRNYLNELDENLESIAPVIRTGNAMTDAIVSSKVSVAVSEGIDVTCDANVIHAQTVTEVDLCTVIGNLFDNAIEACRGVENSFIRVYIEPKGSQLYISFTNSTCGRKLEKIAGLFSSTKGKGRGLGLSSVKKIVEKYEGFISLNSEDGAFSAEILLPR